MKKKINFVFPYYENFRINFEDDDEWYFISPNKLNNLLLTGKIMEVKVIKKRTRKWIE